MKQYFILQGDYAGLCGRRLKQAGRLVLYRMLDDRPLGEAPRQQRIVHWLVQLKSFDEEKDRPRLLAVTGSRFGNGGKRFFRQEEAEACFDRLLAHPECAAEAKKADLKRERNLERLRLARESGQVSIFKRAPQLGMEKAATPQSGPAEEESVV